MEHSNARLRQIMKENRLILELWSHYLNKTPRLLSKSAVEDLARECDVDCDEAFLALFCAACGLDSADNREHRRLEKLYFRPSIVRLDPLLYQNDPYYQTIRFPEVTRGRWELRHGHYAPYEPFVRTHPLLTEDLREIPLLGYFDTEFPFPAVLENGVEWMTVTPNEIETMKKPLDCAKGHVLTLGLGLGYFAFCASEKEDVESVTVVEWDADVIALFREYLLPQFPHKEKVRILQGDAFAYMECLDASAFDYVFADLWHDASDGLEMYIRLCRIMKAHPTLPVRMQ